jgi:hypothetical protein
MIKRFTTLFLQDLIVAYRNGFIWVTLLLLVIMSLLVLLLPEKVESQTAELFYDGSVDQVMTSYLRRQGADESAIYTDRAALDDSLRENKGRIGIVFSGSLDHPAFTIITSGQVAEENLNLLAASLESMIADLRGTPGPENYRVEMLRPSSPPIPFNLVGIPVFIVFEVVLLGFFIVAVLVFQEKQEGVLRAYRVSPAGPLAYILSKNLLFIVLAIPYGGLLVLIGYGFRVNFLNLFILIVLSSALMTSFGLFVAVFFNNVSEWFFVGVFVLLLNMLPLISYGLSVYAPVWLTWIPSYPVVFGVREILFPTGKTGFMLPTAGLLLAQTAVALAAAYWAVSTRLMPKVY